MELAEGVTEVSAEPGEGVVGAPAAVVEPLKQDFSSLANDEEDLSVLKGFFGDRLEVIEDKPEETPLDTAKVETPAVDAAAVTTETAPVTGLTEEQITELKAQAEFGATWSKAFAEDPLTAVGNLLKGQAFTPETRAALVETLQRETEQAEASKVDLTAYEPIGELEKALMPHLEFVRNGAQAISQELALRDRDIQATYVDTQALNAKVDFLLKLQGVEVPDVDHKAVYKTYDESAEGTLKAAVDKVYRAKLQELASVELQKRAERPSTLSSEARGDGTPIKPKTIEQAYEMAGAMLAEA